MTGKTKGIVCGGMMVAGVALLIIGLTRDGESGGAGMAITGGILFVAAWVLLSVWTPTKKQD